MEGIATVGLCLRNFRIPMTRTTLRAQVSSVIHYLIPFITRLLIWFTSFQATIHGVHSFPARLYMFEDNEAVNRTIIEGRSSNL